MGVSRCLFLLILGLAQVSSGAVKLATLHEHLSSYPSQGFIAVPLGVYLATDQLQFEFGPFPINGRSIALDLYRSDNPAGWDGLVAKLTNGQNDYIFIGQSDYPWQGGTNVGKREGAVANEELANWGIGNPDLQGATIEYIHLTASTWPIPGDGVGDFSYRTSDQTWEIWGAPAPEPSTWMALLPLLLPFHRSSKR